jgi:hypothetical protein
VNPSSSDAAFAAAAARSFLLLSSAEKQYNYKKKIIKKMLLIGSGLLGAPTCTPARHAAIAGSTAHHQRPQILQPGASPIWIRSPSAPMIVLGIMGLIKGNFTSQFRTHAS